MFLYFNFPVHYTNGRKGDVFQEYMYSVLGTGVFNSDGMYSLFLPGDKDWTLNPSLYVFLGEMWK